MTSDDSVQDFNLILITRDLARKPEIRHLARVLQSLGPHNDPDNVLPVYVYQAYKLIEKPGMAELLVTTLQICKKG